MIFIAKTETANLSIKKCIAQHEHEIILLVFFLLRFGFKNILDYAKYFTEQPIFSLSNKLSVLIGSIVLLLVCILLALILGHIIKSNKTVYEKPTLILVSFFLACPASLPFLFNAERASGTQLLYPFALFMLAILLAGIPVFKWAIPVICVIYFVPAFHSSEMLFILLHKGAILYVPLIIIFLFLQMMKTSIKTNKEKTSPKNQSIGLLIVTVIAGVGSYMYSYTRGYRWGEAFGVREQKIDLYVLVALLIISPALAVFGAVFYKAIKGNFPTTVFSVFLRAQVLLLPLFAHNYTGLWIPFLVISLAMVVFYSLKLENPAMLSAVQNIGEFFLERQFLFFIVLITMASLSNVSSTYLSSALQKIFSQIPY